MKNGKHAKKKFAIIEVYSVVFFIATLFFSIGYAQIYEQDLEIGGTLETEGQNGVFITDVTTTDTNSSANSFVGTMLNSTTVLSSPNSTVSYQITMYNNSDSEYVFIGELTDITDKILYSNPNIEYTLNGITKGETTITPNNYLTFTITFKYKVNANTTINELHSKINFRFRQKPVLELRNNEETYTLTDIGIGHIEEYEIKVSNYNQTYTNGVPLAYKFETELTEGSPFETKIYDEDGVEVTGNIEIAGDKNTKENHTYTLKLIWDSIRDNSEYMGKEYNCQVRLIGKPDDTDYAEYNITKGFEIDITTKSVIPVSTVEQLLKMGSNEIITINGISYTFSADASYELQNDIEFQISDYIEEYPDAFEERAIIRENEITNYETANSEANQYYTYTAPATGTYKLQVWGAQGGYRAERILGGLGGYSIGTIALNQGDKLYVYVGGEGGKSDTPINGIVSGGYNGGGYRYGYTGGGGATDIRFTAGTWNSSSSLLSRVIVAGGGGSEGGPECCGGYGGGTKGESAWEGYTQYEEYCGLGGTLTHSGYSSEYTISTQTTTGLNADSIDNFAGGFGFGGGRNLLK